jgi:hypothetical protein
MATCLDVITYAMRQCRILGLGKEPKAREAEEGMVALQALYDQWRTGGMFGTLEDIYLDGDDIGEEGKRYFVPTGYTLTAATSVYLDSDEVTRQPRDLALYEVLTQAGAQTARLYDRIEWVDLLGLELTDTAPLSSRNAYGLAACLATSGGFSSAFGGQEPPIQVVALARHFLRSIMGKKGSTQDRGSGEYF